MKKTEQEEFWAGTFGNEYTLRNTGDWDAFYKETWGITRTELNEQFLSSLKKDALILEVGCNRGYQLNVLQEQGFTNLWGIDINKNALILARENKNLNIVEGSAFDLPFKDNFFDLVFTSGLLIHISPDDMPSVMNELYRVTKRFIWSFEYFSEDCVEIEYRGNKNQLWKNNFLKLFTNRFPNLEVVEKRMINYLESKNVNMMFLLEKN